MATLNTQFYAYNKNTGSYDLCHIETVSEMIKMKNPNETLEGAIQTIRNNITDIERLYVVLNNEEMEGLNSLNLGDEVFVIEALLDDSLVEDEPLDEHMPKIGWAKYIFDGYKFIKIFDANSENVLNNVQNGIINGKELAYVDDLETIQNYADAISQSVDDIGIKLENDIEQLANRVDENIAELNGNIGLVDSKINEKISELNESIELEILKVDEKVEESKVVIEQSETNGSITINGSDIVVADLQEFVEKTDLAVIDWIEPVFQSGYRNHSNALSKVGYTKDSLGNVYIQGMCYIPTTPVEDSVVFQLPARFRPRKTIITTGISNSGAILGISISSTGELIVFRSSLSYWGTWFGLGVSYKAEV